VTDEPPKPEGPRTSDLGPPTEQDKTASSSTSSSAIPASAADIETGPTAAPRHEGIPAVEVSPELLEQAMAPAPKGDVPTQGDAPTPVPFDAPTQPTGPAAAVPDDAILPASLDDNALHDAVGASAPRSSRRTERDEPTDDDGLPRSGNRRVMVVSALAIAVGLAATALVFLGRANVQRYMIACTTDQVLAEQGRAFPPWGSHPLTGAEWKPVMLPPNAECRPRETDNRSELEGWFLDLLVERASTTLTARDLVDSVQPGKTNPLDLVAAQLNQALLLSRAPERRDQRKEVERLLGDVQYWRATLRLRDAAAALADAARQFDAAAAQRPRHVTDAGDWATFLRRLVDDLHAGPSGVPAVGIPTAPTGEPASEHPSAPLGTALPVEPEGSAAEPAPAPDAGLPSGGVLL
jgi:hypothetical protein